MLTGVLRDIRQDKALPLECVCALVTDFDVVVIGPPLAAALAEWPGEYQVVSSNGTFSPAGGFQMALDFGVKDHKPAARSLVFRMDADMVVYPGFLRRVLDNVEEGKYAYAPVAWSTHKPGTDKAPTPYSGWWRVTGTGMIGFFFSDFMHTAAGKLPLTNRTRYGSEDIQLFLLMSGYVQDSEEPPWATERLLVRRTCAPDLWHIYHPHQKWNQDTFDGRHYRVRRACGRSSWRIC